MFPFPEWKKISLADIILALFDADRMKEGLPHTCIFIFIGFCLAQSFEFFVCQVTQIVFAVFYVYSGRLAVIINDHPVFGGHTV